MQLDFEQLIPSTFGGHASLLIGANGSGKSRILRRLAEHYRHHHRVTILCNTPHDRFRGLRGVQKHTISSNSSVHVMKHAITDALEAGPFRLNTIALTLEYLGYAPEIGIRVDGFREKVVVSEALEEHRSVSVSEDELKEISSALAAARRLRLEKRTWLDLRSRDFAQFEHESLLRLVRWESVLRKLRILRRVDLYLKKGPHEVFDMQEASSGELTLLSTFSHLALNTKARSVILVDEPENSLHPLWQYNYVERLLALLDFREPEIYIATHAPIIVSGARERSPGSTRVFRVRDGQAALLDNVDGSVEGTLAEVFGTITPQNHYVSRQITELLGELSRREATLEQAETRIATLRKGAYSDEQKRFLDAVVLLARKVDDRGVSS